MYQGRFAPSPTGPLHIGSLTCALASFLDARAAGGTWRVRIEDLDPPREVPGAGDEILRTLDAHGLHWDGPVLYQHDRHDAYQSALRVLIEQDLAFPCSLSRSDLAAFGQIHPGRQLSASRLDHRQAHAWRIPAPASPVCFDDRIQGRCCFDLAATEGAFVVYRREGLFAYQLAVVVDDAFQGITHVVRGHDLLDSTARQLLLQDALGLPHPVYAHLPVITGDDGAKLSKQAHAASVTPCRSLANLRLALRALGQDDVADAATAIELLAAATANWCIGRVPRQSGVALSAL